MAGTVHQEASTGEFVREDGAAEAAVTQIDGKPIMALKIYSPFNVYFDEPAFSVSATNATGPFDILPRHHNFMSLLGNCELALDAPSGPKRIRISGGLMLVHADEVRVFLDV